MNIAEKMISAEPAPISSQRSLIFVRNRAPNTTTEAAATIAIAGWFKLTLIMLMYENTEPNSAAAAITTSKTEPTTAAAVIPSACVSVLCDGAILIPLSILKVDVFFFFIINPLMMLLMLYNNVSDYNSA